MAIFKTGYSGSAGIIKCLLAIWSSSLVSPLSSRPNKIETLISSQKTIAKQIVIYTGPIDAYFADKGLPKLEYRSIDFHIERQMNTEFYQPYSVVNYPSNDTPYTRCVEYKHFLNQLA